MISLLVKWTEYRQTAVKVENNMAIPDLDITAGLSAHTVFRRLWRNESARRQVERAQRYAFGEVYVYDGRGKCLAVFSDHNTGEYTHVASLTEEINKARKENK